MLQLFLRNSGFLFLAFAASAYVNVVPQLVFARTVPVNKSLWLSATLLIGTVACIAAVQLARVLGYGRRPGLGGSLVAAAVTALLFVAPAASTPWLFAVLCIVLRALCQYASQETDRRAAALAGVAGRGRNDAISLSLRFAGMLAGPLYMGLHPDFDRRSAVIFLALGGLAIGSALAVAKAPPIDGHTDSRGTPPAALRDSERLVIWAARLSFACYAMLTACVLYALRDLHGLADAARRGSTLITAAFGAALLATPVLSWLRARVSGRALWGMLPAPLCIAAAGLLLPLPSAGRLLPALVGAAVLGIAFAAFQLSFRDYASHQALEGGRKELLAVFNNLSNTSALLAFLAMFTLSVAARALGRDPAQASCLGVALMGLAATVVTIWAAQQHARTST